MARKALSQKQLKDKVAFLERNLVRSGMATEEEVKGLLQRFEKRRDKDSYWERWAELKALVMTRSAGRAECRSAPVLSDESLDVAIAALSETVEEVQLPSISRTVNVVPASFKRIELLEGHAWVLARLQTARAILTEKAQSGDLPKQVQGESCETCGRPLEVGKIYETISRLEEEVSYQRSWLYAQVTSSSPAPATEPVDWGDKITPAEEVLLMQAYHRTNHDIITRLPEPKSEDGQRALPRSWAFLFATQASRERRSSVEVMRDRSLGATIAVLVLEAIRYQQLKKEGKTDATGLEDL